MTNYNIYCDESCHLENDGINVMVLGGVWCPHDTTREINERIRDIKIRNSISPTAEMKWTKISPSKLQLYIDLVNYFFDEKLMHFRAVVVPDKNQLDHERFNQTHDDWYYKMYFEMLKQILMPKDRYEIYIDVKDTNSSRKAQKLREVCSNSMYDFSKTIIRKIQPIQSKEVQLMQVVDILIGALGYANRQFADEHVKSSAKLAIIDLIKKRSGYSLSKTTLLREEKFNILIWDAR
ncbi:MAG: DUF3800 domain-containing protein [Eubacteriales bacterium]|nr:DUF3800 domain-containing protein [Eubacteriales bacterium]